MKIDVLCLGGASADLILRVPRMPARDEKMVVEFAGRVAGGLVANTACAAARFGLKVQWAGLLGDDDNGRILRDDFAAFGVDDSLAEIHPGTATDFTVILLDPSGERTILVAPTLPAPLPLTDHLLDSLAQTRMVYTLPYSLDWFTELAAAAHENGGLMAVDVETSAPAQGDDLRAILKQSDLIFCNRHGLALTSGEDNIESGATRLLDGGARCVAVTLGREGAWALSREESARVAGHAVNAVDTTGAGDCFHGAFLFGYLSGWPLERTTRFANAAAALSVQKVGARAGFPTRAEVERFLG